MKLSSLAITAAFAAVCVAPMPAACQQTSNAGAQGASKDTGSAQPAKRLVDGHPDLNGFWLSSAGPDTPVGGFDGPLGTGPRRQPDNGAKARAADPNQPPYKSELLAKVKELARDESKTDPAFYCKPGGVPRIGPPHAIIQSPGMPIVFLYQVIAGNTFRLVPTDGRPHDPESDDTYYGDSTGHWEGDTLVVDTIHLNDDTWLGLDGLFHSNAMHVTERIRREGNTLHYQATVEDPNVFTRPWVMNPKTSPLTTQLIVENFPCTEKDESHIVDFGLKTTPQ